MRVVCRRSGNGFDVITAKFRQPSGDLANAGRLISLASIGGWRHVRRIGLQDDPIKRDPACRVVQVGSALEGDRPSQSNVHAEIENVLCIMPVTGKAVQDPIKWSVKRTEYVQHFSFGVSLVNDERDV